MPNLASQKKLVTINSKTELIYNPTSPKDEKSLKISRKQFYKSKASAPLDRHPVLDPSMTSKNFFHETIKEGGSMSIRNYQTNLAANILKRKLPPPKIK